MPRIYQKLVVKKLISNFRHAVGIVEVDMCQPAEDEVCIKNRYVGLNADDVNLTSGRYFLKCLPCDVGFEGIGEVVTVGSNVTHWKVGDKAVYFTSKYNAYAEYSCVPVTHLYSVPEIKPEYLVLVVSGLTPCIGLDKVGQIKKGETVVITAAAGGLGHIAVQWAKLAGCHTVGTCSSEAKEKVLKDLGCDRIINYKKEDIAEVLSKNYPRGVDVVWETVGGEMLEACLKNLASKGRIIVAGGVSGYRREGKEALPRIDISNLPELIWFNSKSVLGYNMENYDEYFSSYFTRLCEYFESGKIRTLYNVGCNQQSYQGFEGIISGTEHLHGGRSIGKTVVKL